LLNAAALFALFRAGGGTDPDLLAKARQQVLACRRADPTQRPSLTVFSPRFIVFFDEADSQTAELDQAERDQGP
jgi:hypothetical protein